MQCKYSPCMRWTGRLTTMGKIDRLKGCRRVGLGSTGGCGSWIVDDGVMREHAEGSGCHVC